MAISNGLGMRPLTDRVIALKERAEAVPEAPPVYPNGLTRREVEVLGLVAEALIIGVRTVTTHVSNILNKVGAANRTEAASYAVLRGLHEPLSGGEG